MTIQRIQAYPMVDKFKSLEDVEKYLEKLRRCLSEDQYLRNYDIDVDTTGANHWAFKTITGITNNVVADQMADTLTLASGNATLGIVGTTATDTITWTWAHLGIEGLTDPGADRILFWDDGETASKWLAPNAALEISTTNLNVKYDGTTIGLNGSNQLYAILSGLTHNLFSVTHPDTVAASPVLGDIPYGNVTPAWTKLAGNITTTKKFLSQTGTGTVSAVPSWETLAVGDLPAHQLDSSTYHTVSGLTIGHFLKATGATTFGFGAHGLTYSDVGAAPTSHAHAASEITSGTLLHERGGLEADVSAYTGLLKISAGATSQVTDNSSNWNTAYGWGDHVGLYTPILHKTTEDAINGLVSVDGAGVYSAKVIGTDVQAFITAGTSAQYWRGDKTWQTLNQAAVSGLTTADGPLFDHLHTSYINMNSRLGVGIVNQDNASVYVGGDISTGAAQYSFVCDGTYSGTSQTNILCAGGAVKASTTIATWYALRVLDPNLNTAAAITTLYGLKIDQLTAGGTNYSIYTGTNPAYFGGLVQCASFRLNQTPTAGTFTPDSYVTMNFNGTSYKVPVLAA